MEIRCWTRFHLRYDRFSQASSWLTSNYRSMWTMDMLSKPLRDRISFLWRLSAVYVDRCRQFQRWFLRPWYFGPKRRPWSNPWWGGNKRRRCKCQWISAGSEWSCWNGPYRSQLLIIQHISTGRWLSWCWSRHAKSSKILQLDRVIHR